MIIIAERVNASRPGIWKAIRDRDKETIVKEITNQDKAGAEYIDLNAGTGSGETSEEIDDLRWLIDCALECTEKKFSVDTADPEVLKAGVEHLDGRRPWMLNSIKAEDKLMEETLPFAAQHGAPVIALAMDESGIPTTAERRVAVCKRIRDAAAEAGVAEKQLFFDALAFPIATDVTQGPVTLETIRRIKKELPSSKTTLGLSNVSHGLPKRAHVNRAFLVAAFVCGLDSALCDPTRPSVAKGIALGELVSGHDKYCRKYTRAARGGLFDG